MAVRGQRQTCRERRRAVDQILDIGGWRARQAIPWQRRSSGPRSRFAHRCRGRARSEVAGLDGRRIGAGNEANRVADCGPLARCRCTRCNGRQAAVADVGVTGLMPWASPSQRPVRESSAVLPASLWLASHSSAGQAGPTISTAPESGARACSSLLLLHEADACQLVADHRPTAPVAASRCGTAWFLDVVPVTHPRRPDLIPRRLWRSTAFDARRSASGTTG